MLKHNDDKINCLALSQSEPCNYTDNTGSCQNSHLIQDMTSCLASRRKIWWKSSSSYKQLHYTLDEYKFNNFNVYILSLKWYFFPLKPREILNDCSL